MGDKFPVKFPAEKYLAISAACVFHSHRLIISLREGAQIAGKYKGKRKGAH